MPSVTCSRIRLILQTIASLFIRRHLCHSPGSESYRQLHIHLLRGRCLRCLSQDPFLANPPITNRSHREKARFRLPRMLLHVSQGRSRSSCHLKLLGFCRRRLKAWSLSLSFVRQDHDCWSSGPRFWVAYTRPSHSGEDIGRSA